MVTTASGFIEQVCSMIKEISKQIYHLQYPHNSIMFQSLVWCLLLSCICLSEETAVHLLAINSVIILYELIQVGKCLC